MPDSAPTDVRVLTVTYRPISVSVWDARNGSRITQYALPAGEPDAVDLVGVGKQVVSASIDPIAHQWDVDGSGCYMSRSAVKGAPWEGGFPQPCWASPSADGAYVGYFLCDGVSATILEVSRGQTHSSQAAGSWYFFGGGSWYSPRAEYLHANGGTMYVWDGRTGRVRTGPHPVGDLVAEVDHSPDGSRVVVSELAGTVTLLDGSTLQPVGKPVDPRSQRVLRRPRPGQPDCLRARRRTRAHGLLKTAVKPVGAGGPRGRRGHLRGLTRAGERELGGLLPGRETRGRGRS